MPRKIILIEDRQSPLKGKLKRILRLLPAREKGDRKLQRLLTFRLRVDGESKTREYLIRNIKKIIQCSYTGSFYDFIKDDAIKMECDS
jgi:hypothetical protein